MPTGTSPKVEIVVLNLNGYSDTRECLESLQRVEYSNFHVIVVDNGSRDDSWLRLQGEFPEVKVLRCQENLGFTGGSNLGIEEALRRRAAYVLLLNNDTVVAPDFLKHLVEAGEKNARIGILGPKILYASDPKRIWYAGGYVKYGTGRCSHVGKGQLDRAEEFSTMQETAFVTGCALLVKASVLGEIGWLDLKLFAYWEDADFCMRAREAGYRCVFVPMARVWHKISQTAGHESPFTLYLATRNQLNWVAKHVPFPYKLCALALAIGKKLIKMSVLSIRDPSLASAVGRGIWAFFAHVYGPPQAGGPPGSRASARA